MSPASWTSSLEPQDGSIKSRRNAPRITRPGMPSDSLEDEAQSDQLEEWLSMLPAGLEPIPFPHTWTSIEGSLPGHHLNQSDLAEHESEVTHRHETCMQSYLDDFDNYFRDHGGTVPWPSPVQVFPARIRLPGEQLPYRLADGVSTTQPPRRRRETQTNMAGSVPNEGEDGLSVVPSPQHTPTCSPPSNFTSIFSQPKAQPHMEFGKYALSQPPWNTQRQHHFTASRTMTSSGLVYQQAASYLYPDQPSQMPPAQSPIPQSSSHPSQPPSVMLPNNMVWQPHQALFTQDQQHLPTSCQTNSTQNVSSRANDSNSGPASYWSASSSSLPHGTKQATSKPTQTSVAFSQSAQENFTNSESRIQSLTFNSSSSQSHSSPSNASNTHTSPYARGQQHQEHLRGLNIPDVLEHELEVMPQEGDAGEKVAGEDEKWEDWVDFDFQPDCGKE